ncbi:MAG: hypothetical protein ACK4J0_00380 [Candidatus Anstonellaceae archaeon]
MKTTTLILPQKKVKLQRRRLQQTNRFREFYKKTPIKNENEIVFRKKNRYEKITKKRVALTVCPYLKNGKLTDLNYIVKGFFEKYHNRLIKGDNKNLVIFLFGEYFLEYKYNIEEEKVIKFSRQLSWELDNLERRYRTNIKILFPIEQQNNEGYCNMGYLIEKNNVSYSPKKIYTNSDNRRVREYEEKIERGSILKRIWGKGDENFLKFSYEQKIEFEYRICADVFLCTDLTTLISEKNEEKKLQKLENRIFLVSANILKKNNLEEIMKRIKQIRHMIVNDLEIGTYSIQFDKQEGIYKINQPDEKLELEIINNKKIKLGLFYIEKELKTTSLKEKKIKQKN